MEDNWKRLQKEVISNDKRLNGPFRELEKKVNKLTDVVKDPDKYNSGLASESRVESLEEKVGELSDVSHTSIDFTAKLKQLHDKVDSIYTLLETLSDRLNNMEYTGQISYGDKYNTGRNSKIVRVKLERKDEIDSPNLHGDDDFATP